MHLARYTRRLTGRKDSQAYIAAQEQIAQRRRIDEVIAALIVAEAQIRLRLDTVQRRCTVLAFAGIGIVHQSAAILGAEATIGTMTIEVYDVTGNIGIAIVEHTRATIRVQVAHQIVDSRRLQAIDKNLVGLAQRGKGIAERLEAAFSFQGDAIAGRGTDIQDAQRRAHWQLAARRQVLA